MNASGDLQASRDPSRRSWVESANEATRDFPIQNLPFGIFSDNTNAARRVGVAIGDEIVDLRALQAAGLLTLPIATAGRLAGKPERAFEQDTLNDFISLGRDAWRGMRIQLGNLLARDTAILRDDAALRSRRRFRHGS
jgi:fumarylacetoacetase